ncbi:hypothetical protein [Salinimonas lutimaris]|uniref:hypothetical protein n=1 Tax=Salinimonas lutimaris TaxID=914153 RepID=UPI0010BFC34E|nr:hypothetical protein [Salinimonas lutimaris]
MKIAFFLLLLTLTGCASLPAMQPHSNTSQLVSAVKQAPRGVPGEFTLQIKASTLRRDTVYLTTDANLHSPTAITLVVAPDVATELTQQFGMPPQQYLLEKSVQVRGVAKRRKVAMVENGQPTNKYYQQTQIRIATLQQLTVL